MKLEHHYSENIENKRILIVGIYPPPLGGIPVHIDRVVRKLKNQKNKVDVIDVIKESTKKTKLNYCCYLIKEIIDCKPQIVHYHTLSLRKFPIELAILILLKFLFKYELITINHTPRFFYSKSWLYKKILNFLINFLNKQVLIGSSTYQSYVDNKISLKNISIESPFLMPDLNQENKIYNKYPSSLNQFFQNYFPIILINGSQMKIWQNIDLYGFDMSLDLIKYLEKDFANIGLIIAISSIGDEKYFEKIKSEIVCKKNIYLFLESQIELWPLIKKSNILIRPTSSDSFAISVAEAISLNVPVVASDVCIRFPETVIFRSRNQEDLNDKVRALLN